MGTTASIRDYIRDELIVGNDSSLRDDTPLSGGLIATVDLLLLVASVEDRFGVEIEDEELTSTQLRTVSDIAALVEKMVVGT